MPFSFQLDRAQHEAPQGKILLKLTSRLNLVHAGTSQQECLEGQESFVNHAGDTKSLLDNQRVARLRRSTVEFRRSRTPSRLRLWLGTVVRPPHRSTDSTSGAKSQRQRQFVITVVSTATSALQGLFSRRGMKLEGPHRPYGAAIGAAHPTATS